MTLLELFKYVSDRYRAKIMDLNRKTGPEKDAPDNIVYPMSEHNFIGYLALVYSQGVCHVVNRYFAICRMIRFFNLPF